MILNLPDSFSVDLLDEFDFGKEDARNDKLLKYLECAHVLPSFKKFLKNDYAFIRGDKGTGKTVLFRMIRNDYVALESNSSSNNVAIFVEKGTQFQAIRHHLSEKIIVSSDDEKFKYVAVWEIYIIHLIGRFIVQRYKGTESIQDILDQVNDVSSLDPNFNINTFLKHIGKHLRFKYSNDIPVLGKPEVEYSRPEKSSGLPPLISIPEFKERIDKFLKDRNITLTILFDNVDRFEVGRNFNTQQDFIYGMMVCFEDYIAYENINLKGFIRPDLYNRIIPEELEDDKYDSITAVIDWDEENLCVMISQRIAYNFFKLFNLDYLEFDYDVDIEKVENFTVDVSALNDRKWLVENQGHSIEEKKTTETEKRAKSLILSLFPEQIVHANADGKEEYMSIFEFFKTHFCFTKNNPNPRIIIHFLTKCIEFASEKQKGNFRKEVLLRNGYYGLISRGDIRKAYRRTQLFVWKYLKSVGPRYKQFIERMEYSDYRDSTMQNEMNVNDLLAILKLEFGKEFRNFISFMVAAGALHCSNKYEIFKKRKYELPVVLKNIYE